jgi:hypothetical protein
VTRLFDWTIDCQNYLYKKCKHSCKQPLSSFIKNIGLQLDEYKELTWDQVRKKDNHHTCPDLNRKKSESAKRLWKHLERINTKIGENENNSIEPFQIAIKRYENKKAYRVFGYIKSYRFYLIYLDPDHEIYKE